MSLSATEAADETEWIAARDLAVMLLLYGAGLRISEALSLTPRTAPLDGRDVMHIKGKGGKERLVPALAIVSDAIAKYMRLCPHPLAADGPLFSGLAVARYRRASSSWRWRSFAASLACQRQPHRTRCAIRSPRIFFRPAPIYGKFRSFWVTPRSRRRKSIRKWIGSAYWPFTTRLIQERRDLEGRCRVFASSS